MKAISFCSEWITRLTALSGATAATMFAYYSLRMMAAVDEEDGTHNMYRNKRNGSLKWGIAFLTLTGVLYFVGTKFLGISGAKLFFLN